MAEPLHDTALVLALEREGVDRAADVGDRDVPLDSHRAGLLVHAHLGRAHGHLPERRAATEGRRGAAGRDHPAADQLAAGHPEPERQRLGIGESTRRSHDHAVGKREVSRGETEALRHDREQLLAHVFGGDLHRAPGHRGRAARARGLIVRRHRGIGLDDRHPVERHAQDLGGDLRQHGARPLTHLDRAREHGHAAVRVQAHDRL